MRLLITSEDGPIRSPRRIILNRKEIHWECSCSTWHEELVHGVKADTRTDGNLSFILTGVPCLPSLSDIIRMCNSKRLRREEDALPGASGLLSVLSRSFEGGFLYGIPIMFFERVLGWQPSWPSTNLHHRIGSIRSAENCLSPSYLSSWSWIAWRGKVPFGLSELMRFQRLAHGVDETIPIIEC